MGSKTFDGVRFAAYTDDHSPPHVHGFYSGTEVILDLDAKTKRIRLSKREPKPPNARQSDVRKIARTAAHFAAEIILLWELAQ